MNDPKELVIPMKEVVLKAVDTEYPYGHPKFNDKMLEIMELHSRKNHDYAHGGKPLGNFERRATIFSLYPGFKLDTPLNVALWDVFKQLDAAMWMLANNYEGSVEGVSDRIRDVVTYGGIALCQLDDKKAEDHAKGS